jgi:hypothetical protein
MSEKRGAPRPRQPDAETTRQAASFGPGPGEGRSVEPVSLETAQQLVGDRYRIAHAAGAGGMGWVFAATDTVLERRVAVKLLHGGAASSPAEPGADATAHGRVLAEARAMAGLRHPNLCRVHEVSLDSRVPFIVMDWIEGIGLAAAWQGVDLDRRLALFLKVVEAVAAAHSAGLVHRDLKPDNILVDRMGEPIIVDFGLARSRSNDDGIFGGTPGYAAPEQFGGGPPVGPAADVYALGAIMFEMLTDRPPFAAADTPALMRQVREEDPPLPETHAPDLPWPLQRICLVALEREAHRRYPDAHAMARDLHRYLRGEAVSARPSMMAEQFAGQVEQQITEIESWQRRGLVTGREADRLSRLLGVLLRPESHWILESRRLSLSQVTLYMGGWFVLVALTIGMYLTWDALEQIAAVRYLTAWGIVIGLLGAAAAMQRSGESRVALGYQMTACLIVPIAAWLTLRETSWLAGPVIELGRVGMGDREWQVVLLGLEPDGQWRGLMNRQVLVIMLAWLGVAVGLRRYSGFSAFTLWAVVAAGFGAVAAWCSAGLLRLSSGFMGGPTRDSLALLGLWILVVAGAALYPGLWLNRREERLARLYGLARAHTRDAWSVLTGSNVMIGLGLTLTAWNAANLYTLTLLSGHDNTTMRAVAFMVNGCALQALSHLLGREQTLLRRRLAEAIRWVSPSHFLASLVVLELDVDEGRAWVLWIVLLFVAAIACCYVSVWKQWRPFLFTGLFYVAVAYYRAFIRLWGELEGEALDTARLMLTGGALALGIATMVLAWRLPAWVTSLKIGRSSRSD